MTMDKKQTEAQTALDTAYEKVVQAVRDMYGGDISDQRARAAADNLIGFFRVLLKMRQERLKQASEQSQSPE